MTPGAATSISRFRAALLERFYRSRYLHWLFRLLVKQWDGSELSSVIWRKLLLKYHGVDVGAYTYGPVLHRGRVPRGTRVGSWCSIGRDFIVRRRNHPIERASQHPFFYNAKLGVVEKDTIPLDTDNPLVIGHDVWVGDRVMVLGECKTIGNGAVLAGGSIVTKDVPAYAIVAGVPAKVVRFRFAPEIQALLETSRWWDLPMPDALTLKDLFVEHLTVQRAQEIVDRCQTLRNAALS